MASSEYNEKLKDPRWQRKRLEIFQRDNWMCQLCCRTDMELHLHHLYRTTEEPWDEPNLHLLTLCRLCHEQQLSNPQGGFKHPKRLYKTDAEWWEEHCHEYDEQVQKELDVRNVSGFTAREVIQKLRLVKERIHVLRLGEDK
jgi:5-methylcytosine-specific restriction endonuclease McrA